MSHKTLNQVGDTIVEVMIAMAVLSSILAGAFLTINKTVINARQAEERSEATKYAEAQIEQMKYVAKIQPASIFGSTNLFCIANNAVKNFTVAPTTTLPALDSDTFPGEYPDPECRLGSIPSKYNVSISRGPLATAPNDFTITARWVSATGTGNEEVSMIYRLYQ